MEVVITSHGSRIIGPSFHGQSLRWADHTLPETVSIARPLLTNRPNPVERSLLQRVAQIAWLVPILLFGLSVHQAKVTYDLHATKTDGITATADVLTIHKDNRKDVTYDYVSLRVALPDGETITRNKLSLPHGLIPPLMGREQLEVSVQKGASIPVVITDKIGPTPVVDTQMRIAGINGLMSLGAALLFGIGIWYWNRSLLRDGDPADRGVTEPDPDHPARQVVRS